MLLIEFLYKTLIDLALPMKSGQKIIKIAVVFFQAQALKETLPLDEDVDAYFAREVLPYRPGAWIDKRKTKVGYEIPFTRTFYEYEELEPAADIAKRIAAREKVLIEKLQALFGNGGGLNE